MVTALLIVGGMMAFALILFAALAWRISPIVFALMRAHVNQAQTMNELIDAVDELGLPSVESGEMKLLKDRVAKLERAASGKTGPTRTRRKVTA